MNRLSLVCGWVFYLWSEATNPPYLGVSPPVAFQFPTLDDCRDARDLALLLVAPNERITGCDDEIEIRSTTPPPATAGRGRPTPTL